MFGMIIDAGPKFYVVWSPTPYMTKAKVTDSNFWIEVFTMSVFVKPLMGWFMFGMVIETGPKVLYGTIPNPVCTL